MSSKRKFAVDALLCGNYNKTSSVIHLEWEATDTEDTEDKYYFKLKISEKESENVIYEYDSVNLPQVRRVKKKEVMDFAIGGGTLKNNLIYFVEFSLINLSGIESLPAHCSFKADVDIHPLNKPH